MPSSTTSSDSWPGPGLEQTRVLIVDDNPAMLARAAAALATTCIIVGQMRDGDDALMAAATLQPDVIVLDISMPGMSGLEVAARLRIAGSRAAIVFLTVHNDVEVAEAALAAGGSGYVIKARLASDLVLAVREARARRTFVSLLR